MMSTLSESTDRSSASAESPPCLSRPQIDRAIEHLTGRWPNQPFTAAQRDAYVDVLGYLRPGELKQALAALASDYRPDPDKVLAAARAMRPRPAPSNDWTNSEPAPAPDWDANRAGLEMCRRRLNGEAA